MIHLRMRRATVDRSSLELADLVQELGPGYQPIVGSALAVQAQILHALPESLRRVPRASAHTFGEPATVFGELLRTEAGVVAVRLSNSGRRSYFVGEDGEPRVRDDELELILAGIGTAAIEDALREISVAVKAKFDIDLRDWSYTSEHFDDLKAQGLKSPEPPSPEEESAALVLSDSLTRRVAIAVASSGGLLLTDLGTQLPRGDEAQAPVITSRLREAGIVASDFVIICRRSTAQVLRVPTREALADAAKAGVKCACGRDLNAERMEEALALSDLGRTMLDGSRWMSVVLMQCLRRMGIDYSAMLIEQKAGGDEMDCFADISGDLALFELKDKEFNLGNAYSFGAKIGIHRPQQAIVVTTMHVGNDAKEHFKRSQDAESESTYSGRRREIHYIEGIQNLEQDLGTIVEAIFSFDAVNLIREVIPSAAADAAEVLRAVKVEIGPTPRALAGTPAETPSDDAVAIQ